MPSTPLIRSRDEELRLSTGGFELKVKTLLRRSSYRLSGRAVRTRVSVTFPTDKVCQYHFFKVNYLEDRHTYVSIASDAK